MARTLLPFWTANVNTIYPALENHPEIAADMNHALPPEDPGGRFGYGQWPWWGIAKGVLEGVMKDIEDLKRLS